MAVKDAISQYPTLERKKEYENDSDIKGRKWKNRDVVLVAVVVNG